MSVEIKRQYQNWPYPDIPLLASIGRENLWQINAEWMLRKAGLEAPARPKIWIAGCGTFQPFVFSHANPNAQILATDISETSLSKAKVRCRLHLKRNVTFQELDLEAVDQLPSGPFDLIECYGVLMNLKDPGKTLKNLADRLSENGLLRIMVYPHYGRQRIFQIQRLAKLLGFSREKTRDPAKFRRVVKSLPVDHPLRETFVRYQDAKNDSGIVDAFLHAGDRAFTAIEISSLIKVANLNLAYTMHRPWGDPERMKEKLSLQSKDYAYVLNYLDVWQSLRSNFILCLTKQRNPLNVAPPKPHPLFSFGTRGLGLAYRAKLLRMAATGTQLQTRTYDGPRDLSGSEVRALLSGKPLDGEPLKTLEPLLTTESRNIRPSPHWVLREGEFAPNPLHAHLFDIVNFKEGNYQELVDEEAEEILKTPPSVLETAGVSFSESGRKANAHQKREVFKFIDNSEIKKRDWSEAEVLELWCLLFSYKDLFWKS